MEYTIKKTNFNNKYTKYMYVFFENGDYISIDGSELLKNTVNVYDRLVRHNKGFCAVAESGCIEFKIKEGDPDKYSRVFLHDPQEFNADRKEYIERRCLNESRITEIWFFDKLNRHYELLGNFSAEADGKNLKISVLPQPHMGDALSDKHKISLGEIRKEDIFRIDLDFENCESFTVYSREIEEIGIMFDKKLVLGSSVFYRRIKDGFIILKLKKDVHVRNCSLFNEKNLKRKDFERRLCGKIGSSAHDICHLYVDFYHAGHGCALTECLELDDLKTQKEIDRLIKQEKDDAAIYYSFESGYAKILKNRTIILTFGKNAKQLLEELCKHKKRIVRNYFNRLYGETTHEKA